MNYPGGAFEASTPSSEQYSTNFPVMSKIFSNSDHPNSSPAGASDLTSSMLASPHHHHEDLSAQHYHNQQLQTQQYQSYAAAGQQAAAAAAAAQSADFSSYGPMYSNYMKCRTNPYQRPNPAGPNQTSPNMTGLPSPAAGMYYPGFSNAAAAAAAAAAGLYTRPHNMYDYSGNMHHHAEVPR